MEEDRGSRRINRVYRQLTVCPALYWDRPDDPDGLYLKNQRQWISRYLQENLGGRLDVHKNAAFWMLEENDGFGAVHPRDAMLPEFALLLCARIQDLLQEGKLEKGEDEGIRMEEAAFEAEIAALRNRYSEAMSREFREMDEERLIGLVRRYLLDWMLLREEPGTAVFLPAAGKLRGFYPEDYEGGKTE